MNAIATPGRRATFDWRRAARRHGWTVGVFVLLAVLVLYWRSSTNLPWGTFDVQSLAIDALPLAFVAMGQAIVIISGGIDLSVGSMMSLVNVLAAKYIATSLGDQTVGSAATPGSFERAIGVSLLLIAFGFFAGALTGLIIHVTKIADIIVTLAMLFVWAGLALAVLEVPGGAVPARYQNLVTLDTVVSDWLPKAFVILLVVYALLWLTIRRRRPGLALYAIGSSRNAASLSGINVPLTRVFAYAMSGAFAALGGLALTAASGIGDPHSGDIYTLEQRRRGRARRRLAARRRRRPARRDRRRVRAHAREDDPDHQGRRPELRAGDPGHADRPRRDDRRARDPPEGEVRRMSAIPEPGPRRLDVRRTVAASPAIVLTFVFVALFIATDIVNRAQSGEAFLTGRQVSTTFLYAAILGLIAAGQTLVMLTGGVDLSVATTATASAFMISSFARDGTVVAILVALGVGLGIGLVNGIGVAIFRVNALIMTLGVSTVTLGVLTIYSQKRFLSAAPDFVVTLGSERFLTYIPYDLLVWAPISAAIILGLRYSGLGRMIYAVGDNPVATRLAGVRNWQVLLTVYALSGLLSAAGGILLVGFNNAADLGIAAPFLLPSVAAVVIGGTSIFGGVGGYSGTILGALILTLLDSLLTILDATQAVRQILYGLIVLVLAAIYARASAAE